MRYRLDLSYLGTRFHGWQRQPNAPSVQQRVEETLARILQQPIELTGAGRTDTGVHARHYVAHFDTVEPIADPLRLLTSGSMLLAPDIALLDICQAPEGFHARFSATARSYSYTITPHFDPFLHDRALLWREELNREMLDWGAARILTMEDFASFCKSGGNSLSMRCAVKESQWSREGALLIYRITANRFLRNMVRAIVGTLLQLGRGTITPAQFLQIIEGKDRRLAGESAPAHGLCLEHVDYPLELTRAAQRDRKGVDY